MSAQTTQKLPVAPRSGARANEARRVQTSRAEVAVRVGSGEGSPILLIHAVGGSSENVEDVFGYAFARDHRVIAVDLPGHGLSGGTADSQSAAAAEEYADTLLETLERLGVDSAFVIDQSREGRIGKELMTIFPGMLGLAVVGGAFHGAVGESSVDQTPVYEIGAMSEDALEPIILSLELREAALSIAPRLWYGG